MGNWALQSMSNVASHTVSLLKTLILVTELCCPLILSLFSSLSWWLSVPPKQAIPCSTSPTSLHRKANNYLSSYCLHLPPAPHYVPPCPPVSTHTNILLPNEVLNLNPSFILQPFCMLTVLHDFSCNNKAEDIKNVYVMASHKQRRNRLYANTTSRHIWFMELRGIYNLNSFGTHLWPTHLS